MSEELCKTLDELGANGERLIAGVTPDQWGLPTPCTDWNVRQLVNHMAFTMRTLGAAARRDDVTWGPDDDHLGADPTAGFAALAQAASAAWRSPGSLDGDVTVPFDMPAIGALTANVLDVGTHCWDLATATGQQHGLSDEHVAVIEGCNRALINDDVRASGGFGDDLSPGGDSALSSMLAFVGRSA